VDFSDVLFRGRSTPEKAAWRLRGNVTLHPVPPSAEIAPAILPVRLAPQSQGSSQTGTRGAKSACTLFFYNVFSDVLLNAEASACGERVAAGQRRSDAAAVSKYMRSGQKMRCRRK
jgi:hypothetical protein